MDTILDYNNPCEVALALRKAYIALLAGGAIQSVKFIAGNASGREVTYNKANLEVLRDELRSYEDACSLLSNSKPRRHVTIAG